MPGVFSMIPLVNGVNIGLRDQLGRFDNVHLKVRRSMVFKGQHGCAGISKCTSTAGSGSIRGNGNAQKAHHPLAGGNRMLPLISFLLILISLPQSVFALLISQQPDLLVSGSGLIKAAPNQTTPLLECIQVSPPVLSPEQPTCQQTLMVHTFGWSYGKPFVGA